MIRAFAYLCLLASPVAAEEIVPPSGVRAVLMETIYEPLGVPAALAKTVRLRYLAPEVEDQTRFDFTRLEMDFEWLCTHSGLPLAAKIAPRAERIVVSIASEATEFGETAPNVVQYFDAFQIENATCVWEGL